MIFSKISITIGSKSKRSKDAIGNIILSLAAKAVSIISSLLIVPLTISYVNPTQYGIWLTLSSIVGWISFFDLGLGNGFRNKFTEAVADNNFILAKQYVSTTYFSLICIVTLLWLIMLFGNHFLSWPQILKVESIYTEELRIVFAIVGTFFCINMVVQVFSTLLTADQKVGFASIINGAGSLISLAVIYILTKYTTGSLTSLALYYSGIPCLVTLIISIIAFSFSSYKRYAPNIKEVRLTLIKDILGLGIRFFLISVSLLLIFQMINIILSRELGPVAVTQYNITNKYFNILHMIMTIIIVPFWSLFTDARVKNDYAWMRNIVKKLEICWIIELIVGLILLAVSQIFFKIWIGDKVEVSFLLSISMLLYTLNQSIGSVT